MIIRQVWGGLDTSCLRIGPMRARVGTELSNPYATASRNRWSICRHHMISPQRPNEQNHNPRVGGSSPSSATRAFSADGESTRSRPSSSGPFHGFGIRSRSMLRAGQKIIDCMPRNNKSKHSFSIGEWKPPMTSTPAVRTSRATSYVSRIKLPGHCDEQKNANKGSRNSSTSPMQHIPLGAK